MSVGSRQKTSLSSETQTSASYVRAWRPRVEITSTSVDDAAGRKYYITPPFSPVFRCPHNYTPRSILTPKKTSSRLYVYCSLCFEKGGTTHRHVFAVSRCQLLLYTRRAKTNCSRTAHVLRCPGFFLTKRKLQRLHNGGLRALLKI
jgi:hypothetical protein